MVCKKKQSRIRIVHHTSGLGQTTSMGLGRGLGQTTSMGSQLGPTRSRESTGMPVLSSTSSYQPHIERHLRRQRTSRGSSRGRENTSGSRYDSGSYDASDLEIRREERRRRKRKRRYP